MPGGAELLDRAGTMRVTSDAGTDIVSDVTGTPVLVEYGFVEKSGRYDVWPGGFLATFPMHGSTNGTFVLDIGDQIFHLNKYVESRVTITVENSYISRVEGDGLDALLIDDYLKSWNDPECYATSHMGWGMNERGAVERVAVLRQGHHQRTGRPGLRRKLHVVDRSDSPGEAIRSRAF